LEKLAAPTQKESFGDQLTNRTKRSRPKCLRSGKDEGKGAKVVAEGDGED